MKTDREVMQMALDALGALTDGNVTYWDAKGEVRHDVGRTQNEAMQIFKYARLCVEALREALNGPEPAYFDPQLSTSQPFDQLDRMVENAAALGLDY